MALADGDAEWVLAQDYYGIYPFQLGLAEIFALILPCGRLNGTARDPTGTGGLRRHHAVCGI